MLRDSIDGDFAMCSLANNAVFNSATAITPSIERVHETDSGTHSSICLSIFCAIEFGGKCATAKICLQVFFGVYLY